MQATGPRSQILNDKHRVRPQRAPDAGIERPDLRGLQRASWTAIPAPNGG
jgi:hypothetical protein